MTKKMSDYLIEDFRKKRQINPKYSIRAYAKLLKLDSSSLSKILNRKRPISFQMAQKIVSRLKIENLVKKDLLKSYSKTESEFNPDIRLLNMTEIELELVSKWYFFPVLSALEIKAIQHTSKKIADFLGVTEVEIIQVFDLLIKWGAVQKVKNFYKLNEVKSFRLPFDSRSDTAQLALREQCAKTLATLNKGPIKENEGGFSYLVVATDAKKIPELGKRIREFQLDVDEFLTCDSIVPTDIYQFNVSLIRLNNNNE